MSRERRATVQVVKMNGDKPKTSFSFNPTGIQFAAWVVAKAAAFIVAAWVCVSFISAQVFDEKLSVDTTIDKKIELQMKVMESEIVERIHEMEVSNGKNEEILKALQKSQDRIEKNINILVRNSNNN